MRLVIRKRDEGRVKAAMLLGCLAARAGMPMPDYGAESWDANPWVWALSFKRITP